MIWTLEEDGPSQRTKSCTSDEDHTDCDQSDPVVLTVVVCSSAITKPFSFPPRRQRKLRARAVLLLRARSLLLLFVSWFPLELVDSVMLSLCCFERDLHRLFLCKDV